MRLQPDQIIFIRNCVHTLAGDSARVWLFGSRVHDEARGGDLDLLLEVDQPVAEPAQLAARVAARVSRSMAGRKVDVLIKAPNLMSLPIHTAALSQGILL
jgi:predicted nucleotidyltransferase